MTAPRSAGSGRAETTEMWIAILEFARPDGGRPFMVDDVQGLISRLAERRPSGLWHPDRYAVQLQVRARNANQGLQRALAYHHDAVRGCALRTATVVRIEVMTVEEYERSLEIGLYDPAAAPAAQGAPLGPLCDELYDATRSLHTATSERDLTDTVIGFVLKVGGRVEPGEPRLLPGIIDVDVTLHGAEARHATAESFSVAGLILEQSLPALLAAARRVLARLQGDVPGANPGQPPTPP